MYDVLTFPEDKYGMLKYRVPGTYEYEAHSTLEPIVKQFIWDQVYHYDNPDYEIPYEDKLKLLKDLDEAAQTVRTSKTYPHHTTYPDDLYDQYDMEK